jgi:hypothetical protein
LERARSVALGNIENTDLQKVFDLVLGRAVKANVHNEEMPKIILIVSDMQFDECVRNNTNLEEIRRRYAKKNLPVPKLIFWNVDSRQIQVPATIRDDGVLLLSGAHPVCLKLALQSSNEGIETTVKEIIDSKRYEAII